MEDIITERGQTPSLDTLTMDNSYCRLNPITCGPNVTELQTQFYGDVEADAWGSTHTLPWMAV